MSKSQRAVPFGWIRGSGWVLGMASTLALAQAPASFPFGFTGADCDALATAIKGLSPKKDEFETSAAYTTRIAGLLSATVVGGKTLDTPLFFRAHLATTSLPAGRRDDSGSSPETARSAPSWPEGPAATSTTRA